MNRTLETLMDVAGIVGGAALGGLVAHAATHAGVSPVVAYPIGMGSGSGLYILAKCGPAWVKYKMQERSYRRDH